MRSSLRGAVIALPLLLLILCWVSAQTYRTEAGGQEQQNKARLPIAQQSHMHSALNWLSQKLSLTDDQKATLQRIFQNEGQQMSSIRENTSLTQGQKRSQVMQLHLSTNLEIESILKPDQQQKFTKIKLRTRETYD